MKCPYYWYMKFNLWLAFLTGIKGVECAFVVLNTPRTYCHANLHALEEFHCS